LVKSAKKSIVLIDNYIDETVLLLLSKRSKKVSAEIHTKHNAQYAPINICETKSFHDRFLIIDDTVYHIGASLKDLGRKLFAFSRMGLKRSDILK
jgi:hypothetical protein